MALFVFRSKVSSPLHEKYNELKLCLRNSTRKAWRRVERLTGQHSFWDIGQHVIGCKQDVAREQICWIGLRGESGWLLARSGD